MTSRKKAMPQRTCGTNVTMYMVTCIQAPQIQAHVDTYATAAPQAMHDVACNPRPIALVRMKIGCL
jgi:hypothetical protein